MNPGVILGKLKSIGVILTVSTIRLARNSNKVFHGLKQVIEPLDW
jgi:hypothetical protein